MSKIIEAYIGLGSNLGNRAGYIRKALCKINEIGGTKVVVRSDLIETKPLGGQNQPKYLNAVAKIETSLSAGDLLKELFHIEDELGRKRTKKWASRTIDLDLLLYGSQVLKSKTLTIPHPQMHLRSFVLKGLFQLDCRLILPVLNKSVKELAARLNGENFTINHDKPKLISIAGNIGAGKTTLAKKLSKEFGCKLILEAYDKNPFLPKVYAGQKELALDSQLFFLRSRVRQLDAKSLKKEGLAVSDYVFDKEIIYANELLNKNQLSLYYEIYQKLKNEVIEPAVVIYMDGSSKMCMERIHQRNRPYEQHIELKFLNSLNKGYNKLLKGWKKCPVIRLPISEFDCMDDNNIRNLKKQVSCYI